QRWRGTLASLCLTLGLTALILGIAGPRWGRDWQEQSMPGRDLVVVLDLSRSMLAQDVLPNRVERARQAIQELSHKIEQRGGHRLALVAFAARPKLFCPLTHDYDHFRFALAQLDAQNLHRELRVLSEESASGTRMGLALSAAVEAHDPRFQGHQDILLISDGDDPLADEEWRGGLVEAHKNGIAVHAVGVGNPDAESPIPLKDGNFMRHEGKIVTTRLKERPLEEMARQGGGVYVPARTHTLALGEIFREHIEPGPQRETDVDILPLYRQRYAWFFGIALALLVTEMLLRGRQ
ncbi:MAG: VWA domain-containing protein, partial [Chloroflexi bacterium]|nr:VWA domain-containing protein [Chloroflexota bacterium]